MKIEFAVIHKKTGAAAVLHHQDDEVTPIVAETLTILLNRIKDWSDMGCAGDALQEMEDQRL